MSRVGVASVAAASAMALVGLAVACARWPLLIWAATLAAFGVPHAIVELRWVGRRYAAAWAQLRTAVSLLAVVFLARLLALQCAWPATWIAAAELVLGMLLVVAVVLSRGAGASRARTGVGAALFALLGWGLAVAPIDSLLVLAVVHNVVPIVLLLDRLRDHDLSPRQRSRWIAAVAAGFTILPLWLATGGAAQWCELVGPGTTATDAELAAPLQLTVIDGLMAFVPSWFPPGRALDLLRTAAFLQCLHYVLVLLVLPRLGPAPRAPAPASTNGPRELPFQLLVAGLAVLFFAAFLCDFRDTRATYGTLAAVHVWAELPAVLLACTPRHLLPITS
ncbi:MAG: hypothetical protein MUC36_28700 [Planctomycetes bacterium]|jgi:hypothetical protein|nr:hypothetical protein [Planctomycetota bacterium]